MTTSNIPPYLANYLKTATHLAERWPEVPPEDVELVAQQIRDLVTLCANRDQQIAKLTERLDLIEWIALDHIDLDAPKAEEFSLISGIVSGDPNVLQHARAQRDARRSMVAK